MDTFIIILKSVHLQKIFGVFNFGQQSSRNLPFHVSSNGISHMELDYMKILFPAFFLIGLKLMRY